MTPERLGAYRKLFGAVSTDELRAIIEGRKPHKLGEEALEAIRVLLAERKGGGHVADEILRSRPMQEKPNSVTTPPSVHEGTSYSVWVWLVRELLPFAAGAVVLVKMRPWASGGVNPWTTAGVFCGLSVAITRAITGFLFNKLGFRITEETQTPVETENTQTPVGGGLRKRILGLLLALVMVVFVLYLKIWTAAQFLWGDVYEGDSEHTIGAIGFTAAILLFVLGVRMMWGYSTADRQKQCSVAFWSCVLGFAALSAGVLVDPTFTPLLSFITMGGGLIALARIKGSRGTLSGYTPAILALVVGFTGLAFASKLQRTAAKRSAVRAKMFACVPNLREIEVTKRIWARKDSKADTDVPSMEDLVSALKSTRVQRNCPSGGTYTIGAVGERAACSFPGHDPVATFDAGGELVGNIYQNKFVGLRLAIPKGWFVGTVEDVRARMLAASGRTFTLDHVTYKTPERMLLVVTDWPIPAIFASTPSVNLSVAVAVVNWRGRKEFSSVDAYLKQSAFSSVDAYLERSGVDFLSSGHRHTKPVVSDITTQRVGETDFYKLNVQFTRGGTVEYQTSLARITNDFLVVFFLTARSPSDLEKLTSLISDLEFTTVPEEVDASPEGKAFRRKTREGTRF